MITTQTDQATEALVTVMDRLMLVDGNGREYPSEEALEEALDRAGDEAWTIYTPNGGSGPETRQDGVFIWLDTKGDTSAEMAHTMVEIIAQQLVECGVTEAHLRPVQRSDFD